MKKIAKTFLAVPHTAPWIYDESASALALSSYIHGAVCGTAKNVFAIFFMAYAPYRLVFFASNTNSMI